MAALLAPPRRDRRVALLAAAGVALLVSGLTAAGIALASWWPCVQGRDAECRSLQYEANPLLEPVPWVWLAAIPVVLGVLIAALRAPITEPLRAAAVVAFTAVAGLNIFTDYAITVGGSADSGPGAGVPMSLGVAIAGAALLVGALQEHRQSADGPAR